MNLIITGAPGSGKGSQTPFIEKLFGVPTISMGNMLREQVARGTELGQKAKGIMDAGGLISDDIIIDMLKARVAEDDCQNGFILDGVPRTLAQAQMIEGAGIGIDAVIVIDVPDSVIESRMSGRRVCEIDGATYHVKTKKPKVEGKCDLCGRDLITRADDNPETVKARLNTYHEITEPMIKFYEDKAQVYVFDGDKTIDEVSADIEREMKH